MATATRSRSKSKLAKREPVESQLRDYGGRPRKFTDIKEVQRLITGYFNSLTEQWGYREEWRPKRKNGKEVLIDGVVQIEKVMVPHRLLPKPPTITGLAMALGTSRRMLLDYEERGEAENATEFDREFLHTIRAAKLVVEQAQEELLLSGQNVTGVIFNLKNNWGWVDKSEVEQSGKQTLTVEREFTDAELAEQLRRSASADVAAAAKKDSA